ncbi:MAG TPA: Ig-like domain-containing protein, partial [Gemmatimonadales bacterium]
MAQVDVQPAGAGLIIGSTQQFTATPRTASGIPVPNRQTTWSSSDPGIATVSVSGLVTAVGLGEVEITARVDGASGSRPVNVSPRPVAQVTVQPPTAEFPVGQSVQLQVTTLDSEGQPLTGRTVLYTSDNPAVVTVSATGLMTGVGAGQTLVRANSEGKEGTCTVTVTTRPATKLGFTTQPANGTAGQALGAVLVAVQDVTGGTVLGATGAVTIALSDNPGNATLGGTLTVNAVAGVATFSNLVLNRVASGYTLQATSGSLTPAISNPFAIAPGPPAALAITTQPPGNTQSGAALNPQPVVQLRDTQGNPVPQAGVAITAVLLGTGGTLNGTPTATTNPSGSAVFSNLAITGSAGVFQIRFTSPNLIAATSSNVAITAAALAITTHPSATAASGVVLAQQPVIRLVDALGAPVPQAGVVISASLTGAGAALGGILSATTNGSGVATFTDLTITGTVGAYQLSFAAPGMAPISSGTINLTAGVAAKLALAVAP